MRIDRKSVFFLAVLVLATGASAQEPLPPVDSWRHQRPEGAVRKDTEPKVTAPKANGTKATAPVREQKSVVPKPAPQPEPQPVVAAPAAQPAFEPPPQAAIAAALQVSNAINALAPQRPGVRDFYFRPCSARRPSACGSCSTPASAARSARCSWSTARTP